MRNIGGNIMEASHINCVLGAINTIMPQIGVSKIDKKGLSVKPREIKANGISIVISLVGDVSGNIIYIMKDEDAKKIASKMMMGMEVNNLDNMSKSALSEMVNMVTGNVATNFSNINVNVDISPPTLFHGDTTIDVNNDQVISLIMQLDDCIMDINVSLK